MKAMQEFVGIRKEHSTPSMRVEYVQSLRRGGRLDRLQQEMTVLVDSDILIEVSRGKNAGIVSQWIDLSNSTPLSYIRLSG